MNVNYGFELDLAEGLVFGHDINIEFTCRQADLRNQANKAGLHMLPEILNLIETL
ncbi:hypothetical protein [Desulfosudis oleivorans]|uniref:hypothetical protein n=1 Tax=Desulfosudis oleivorans TaxID=181663 RepID=UPI001294821A|nr:hypothetical protein [Desulfosudis oleivorans]